MGDNSNICENTAYLVFARIVHKQIKAIDNNNMSESWHIDINKSDETLELFKLFCILNCGFNSFPIN